MSRADPQYRRQKTHAHSTKEGVLLASLWQMQQRIDPSDHPPRFADPTPTPSERLRSSACGWSDDDGPHPRSTHSSGRSVPPID